ncbi:MAG: hypothetical protein IKT39_02520 [Clostridia bacterium]|nr:hypothetical protein [Clostridia bacterium]
MKLTDEQIIKALECCNETKASECSECPLLNVKCSKYDLYKLALDLINRQKAEIERLQTQMNEYTMFSSKEEYQKYLIKQAKSEAIKEFAGRYEKAVLPLLTSATLDKKDGIYACLDILKEMVGE